GRDVDQFIGVEIEVRKDGVVFAAGETAVVILQEWIGGTGHAGYVVGVDEPLRAQRLGVANQQFHRLLPRLAVTAIQHGLLAVSEFHAPGSNATTKTRR